MNLLQVDHVGIEVSDLARAEQFYVGLLGMDVFMRLPDQLLLQCGPQRIALFKNPARRPSGSEQIRDPRGRAHHAFLVSKNELWSAKALFESRRVPFHSPIDWGDHYCLYFLDPDENLLELVHAPTASSSVEWPSSSPPPREGGSDQPA
ncbi:MAG TPA: VOC family protein [Nitrospiria bacterium]|nr:VOC family protein [Nitrospiria bacterium]